MTAAPPITEAQFQRQVTDLATLHRWGWVHFRPARTVDGWRTPVSGPLGAGWPDLVLVRPPRLVFAELKSERGRLTPTQKGALDLLRDAGLEVHVWRPGDLPAIQEVLR
jgi:hypothetical protein